jgi:hypothetical protein
MQVAKAKSSKWLNETNYLEHRFEWQKGFGVFSYDKSAIKNVYKYIENQEEHHKKQKFPDEYKEFLNKFDIDYDEEYIFEKLI